MTSLPRIGEWRRFAWDDYASRWFVAGIAVPYGNQQVVVLQRENRPHYADRAEITLGMWERGIMELAKGGDS